MGLESLRGKGSVRDPFRSVKGPVKGSTRVT